MEYYLFAFDSTHDAIAAQKLLAGLDVIAMPTLREISAGCGMSLRLHKDQIKNAKERMIASDIMGWYLYSVLKEDRHHICELVFQRI